MMLELAGNLMKFYSIFSYPVILSLENHCSVPQQTKMASYLKDILGGILLLYCNIDEIREFCLCRDPKKDQCNRLTQPIIKLIN